MEVEINLLHSVYAETFIERLEKSGVYLTDHSKSLLRLTVAGWFNEAPRFQPDVDRDPQRMQELLWQIFQTATEESHVKIWREANKKVPFPDWFYSLAVSGRKVIGDILQKGF
jgi:hypothetical protein